jgi:hypothetical protein
LNNEKVNLEEYRSSGFWIFNIICSLSYSGQKLSAEAARASSAGDIFKLFFTDSMINKIVLHTNK